MAAGAINFTNVFHYQTVFLFGWFFSLFIEKTCVLIPLLDIYLTGTAVTSTAAFTLDFLQVAQP